MAENAVEILKEPMVSGARLVDVTLKKCHWPVVVEPQTGKI